MSRIQCDDTSVQYHNVILGDFNLDWLDESTKTSMSQIFPGYRQLITHWSFNQLWLNHQTRLHYSSKEDIQSFMTESFFQ